MVRLIIFSFITVLAASHHSFSKETSKKMAIIKADDIRGITANWNRFFKLSREKGVKVSAGIICKSIDESAKEYSDWLRKLSASASVELWNHGWDHKKWITAENIRISEFNGSGYKHQKQHFIEAQRVMEKVLGMAPVAFGAPFNSIDTNTVKIMNENVNMRLFFCYSIEGLDNKVLAPMNLRGESNGTGKPNFEKFKLEYMKKKDISFTALQFHPNMFKEEHFIEYTKILDFLIAEGWKFVLPSEYITIVNQENTFDGY